MNCVVFSVVDDHSRVVLSLNEGDPHSHYINANYVDVSIIIITIIIIIIIIIIINNINN